MRDAVVAVVLRLAIIALVLLAVLAGRLLLRRWQAVRRARVLQSAWLPEVSRGEPAVLLFTGTLCSDCLVQKDVLAGLAKSAAPFRVNEVMAAKQPELAARFGVQSVPATIVLNRDGKPVGVNYGLVGGDVIAAQLESAFGERSGAVA